MFRSSLRHFFLKRFELQLFLLWALSLMLGLMHPGMVLEEMKSVMMMKK